MTTDELETLLRAWGRVYGERPAVDDNDGTGPATHPLARGMEFAPGKRIVLIRQRTNMDRGGVARRRMMAQAAGGATVGLRVLQAAYVDPVPCVETRPAIFGLGERSRPVPPELQRVQRAALDLHAIDTLRGLVLRINYCTLGPHDDKALDVGQRLGSPVGLRVYRESLAHAKGWMHGRLCPMGEALAQ
jgi:hypothetical protein